MNGSHKVETQASDIQYDILFPIGSQKIGPEKQGHKNKDKFQTAEYHRFTAISLF